ncbi:acyltransferase [Methanobrevibacter boviskoreani]|uniref:acyltransferase n=1 Tax=Methanobrevibacter boviskoreani TaxID=1348249 RepID=UPI000593E6F2|nr:acyltransferase family protein [Methanobrevibacter boviskoreani]
MNIVNNSKKRILYLDSLRVLAIVCVVLMHVSTRFNVNVANFDISALINAFIRVGIPLFFMVSGALLIGKSNENFIGRRFNRILKPYIFWVIVYFLVGILLFNGTFSLNYFLDILLVKASITTHFWFIYCLLGGYLLIPIVNGYLKIEKDKGLKYLLVLLLLCTVLTSLDKFVDLNVSQFKIIFINLPFLKTPLFYFVIGYYLNNKKFNISNKKLVLISIILIAIGYVLELFYLHTSNHGFKFPDATFLLNYHLIIESIGVFIFFKYFDLTLISSKLNSLSNSRLIPIVRNISGCSFGIYFVHYVIIKYLFEKGHLFYQFTVGKAYLWIPITFLVIFLISWFIIYLMSKIPILKIGSGFK